MLERIVRPALMPDNQPTSIVRTRRSTAYRPPIVHVFGKGGSVQTGSGSASESFTFYEIKRPKETQKGF